MIAPPAGTRIWIAAGVTDMRRGFDGLAAMVQTQLEADPFSGQIFAFRGRRGDRIKTVVVGWRRLVPVLQTPGTRPFCLAASEQRQRVADDRAVVDAVGGH